MILKSPGDGKQPVEVLTVADIEKDYTLIRAKLELLQKEPPFTAQLCSESSIFLVRVL